jgi:hypothetical protein
VAISEKLTVTATVLTPVPVFVPMLTGFEIAILRPRSVGGVDHGAHGQITLTRSARGLPRRSSVTISDETR